jgi:hypothetical protein
MFLSAAEIAALKLPGLPASLRGVQFAAARGKLALGFSRSVTRTWWTQPMAHGETTAPPGGRPLPEGCSDDRAD